MSAWQRVRRLLGSVALVDLLFNLVSVSFKKVGRNILLTYSEKVH
jgi:hypothetical protein